MKKLFVIALVLAVVVGTLCVVSVVSAENMTARKQMRILNTVMTRVATKYLAVEGFGTGNRFLHTDWFQTETGYERTLEKHKESFFLKKGNQKVAKYAYPVVSIMAFVSWDGRASLWVRKGCQKHVPRMDYDVASVVNSIMRNSVIINTTEIKYKEEEEKETLIPDDLLFWRSLTEQELMKKCHIRRWNSPIDEQAIKSSLLYYP
ncbi:MAG: hypothetical protein KAV41_02155 [Candidatus Pacebacteria bacterium]|nr:hypothetical protein [Candidatus Paceibacterota bacterium]